MSLQTAPTQHRPTQEYQITPEQLQQLQQIQQQQQQQRQQQQQQQQRQMPRFQSNMQFPQNTYNHSHEHGHGHTSKAQLSPKGIAVIALIFAALSNSNVHQLLAQLLRSYIDILDETTQGLNMTGVAVITCIFFIVVYIISQLFQEWLQ
tara:strand:- start:39 stop:485 length:447 start_codon:yes stop_codon:yes gene_type:complete